MTTVTPFEIRPAHSTDCSDLADLIRELAAYVKLPLHAKATRDDLERNLFGPRPFAEAVVAVVGGQTVGFALFFHTFSTFRGQPGIYLEDIFVLPAYRGGGIGKALFARLAALAVERGCGRLEWVVLKWNTRAIGFYQSLGALPMDELTTYRLSDTPLLKLASFETTATEALKS